MKIDFEFETQYGKYKDALYLPDDHNFTQQQIEEMQVERLNAWVYTIENPIVPDVVTVDGVTYEKIEVDGQILLKPIEV